MPLVPLVSRRLVMPLVPLVSRRHGMPLVPLVSRRHGMPLVPLVWNVRTPVNTHSVLGRAVWGARRSSYSPLPGLSRVRFSLRDFGGAGGGGGGAAARQVPKPPKMGPCCQRD